MRERRQALLGSERCRRVYEMIRARPGMTVSELAERAQLQWTAAQFHVLRLEAADLVRTYRVGRRRLVFLSEEFETAAIEDIALLEDPSCRRIATAIVAEPGIDALRLVDATGLSSRVVYHHARRLIEQGLVATPETGHYRGLRPTVRLYALLAERA